MKISAIVLSILLTVTLCITSVSAATPQPGEQLSDGTLTHAGFIKLCSLPEQSNQDACIFIFFHAYQALSIGYLTVNRLVLKNDEPIYFCMDKAAKLTGKQLLEDYIEKTKALAKTPQGKQQALSTILAQYLAIVFPTSSC
ncbi:hypothetical protein H5123_11025 [Shewanella sp. SR43-4]|uniref:hypothetical protein n=1 Tax=unclassified Shewanella TaxID=196818 RepID=UPI0015F7DF7E|nr:MULTISPECIES: hypothetical protein [unclassified Shewanella]MBB1318166.1 hypothetical protein [Shewanella sp. SR43-4]MBB1477735.1 hypothetical protein [Shewanella sp. SG41-3]